VELGFNLAWVVLSFALSIGWACSAAKSRNLQAHRASFLALVVLIAVLFPVVSITDDIHDQPLTSEEPRYKDDPQHRLNRLRLESEPVALPLELSLMSTAPALTILLAEEVRGPVTPPIISHTSFPPKLHDLPPPALA
jgi:hypothetical protein